MRRIGEWEGCEETQGRQTTGSSGQQQVTDTHSAATEQQRALPGKHKQGLAPKASFMVSEKFQGLKDWKRDKNPQNMKRRIRNAVQIYLKSEIFSGILSSIPVC